MTARVDGRAALRVRARSCLEEALDDAHTPRPGLRATAPDLNTFAGSYADDQDDSRTNARGRSDCCGRARRCRDTSLAAVGLKWNQLLQSTLPQPGNPLTPRFDAMTHIAMFDAVNAIERDFEPYRVRWRPGQGGSSHAAAAQAAHDVLVALNPSAAAAYDEALAADLVFANAVRPRNRWPN